MRDFEILFDHAEPSPVPHPAYARYGNLGFPPAPPDRPWIYSNFVQSLDGIASFRGKHPTGGDIAQSQEDKWLMGLLRTHADAIIMGLGTLLDETRGMPELNGGRGPVYRVEDPALCDLRRSLGRRREKVIFVTASARLEPSLYRVFDGDQVDAFVLTTTSGAAKLLGTGVNVISAGQAEVDFALAARILLRDYGIEYLLCEGGPTLYGHMSRAGLIDEKFLTISPIEIGLVIPPDQEPAAWEKVAPPLQRPTTFTAPGFTRETAPWWRWMSSRRVDDYQFDRYRRRSAE
jgi:riboflavin biosynthesis pyrimidine reductase